MEDKPLDNMSMVQQDMVRLMSSCKTCEELHMLAYTFNQAYKVLLEMMETREELE